MSILPNSETEQKTGSTESTEQPINRLVAQSSTYPVHHGYSYAFRIILRVHDECYLTTKDGVVRYMTHMEILPDDKPDHTMSGSYDLLQDEAEVEFRRRCRQWGLQPGDRREWSVG